MWEQRDVHMFKCGVCGPNSYSPNSSLRLIYLLSTLTRDFFILLFWSPSGFLFYLDFPSPYSSSSSSNLSSGSLHFALCSGAWRVHVYIATRHVTKMTKEGGVRLRVRCEYMRARCLYYCGQVTSTAIRPLWRATMRHMKEPEAEQEVNQLRVRVWYRKLPVITALITPVDCYSWELSFVGDRAEELRKHLVREKTITFLRPVTWSDGSFRITAGSAGVKTEELCVLWEFSFTQIMWRSVQIITTRTIIKPVQQSRDRLWHDKTECEISQRDKESDKCRNSLNSNEPKRISLSFNYLHLHSFVFWCLLWLLASFLD